MTKGAAMHGGLVLLLALLFGLGFGLNYGSSNQTTYLLPSLKALHPALWTRDWLITSTHCYHPAYAWLGTVLLRLSPGGAAIAWANVVFIAGGMLSMYGVLRLLAGQRAFAAFCLLLVLASVTRTLAPGGSYAFSEVFQPSTLGSVGLLTAMLAFVAGQPLLSGLCMAVGGAFHVNYLVLGLCVFGIGWLLTGRERVIRRALAGLLPPLGVLVFFLPFLLASASPSISAEAQRIFQDVRSPHHYCVPRFAWDFAISAGFQLLGSAALLGPTLRGDVVQRRVLTLLVSSWLLVIPAALLSSVIVVRFVKQLMAWRICGQMDLLAQAALCAALVGMLCEGQHALARYDRRARILAGSGVAALLLGSIGTGSWNGTLLVISLCAVALLIAKVLPRGPRNSELSGLSLGRVTAAAIITLVAVNTARFTRFRHYSNLLSGGDRGVATLCNWAQANTPQNALFLTPPREDELRLRCRRAIVVDWKSPSAMPDEVLQWFKRIEDVSGRSVNGDADLAGYDNLSPARVASLQRRYSIDYVVVQKGHELALGSPVYSGDRFVAYALNRASAR